MIEIKNLKQIGTPREESKIYIEHMAYARMREEGIEDKRVFVLMGHTERMEGRYATFIEAVVPVREAEFLGNIPQWNNGMWSQVFRDIKRLYEDLIIVGWAVDVRGMAPSMTVELERVHREHFGGVHQVLFLTDTLEQDETFYIYKENKLVPKDGFYIYYRARKAMEETPAAEIAKRTEGFKVIDLSKDEDEGEGVALDIEMKTPKEDVRPRYRELMVRKTSSRGGNGALAVAAGILVFLLIVGVYENSDVLFKTPNALATEVGGTAEPEESEESEEAESVDGSGYQIPVEENTEN